MYQPARDREGMALVLDQIFEREYDLFRLGPQLEGKPESYRKKALASVARVTLSPGYEVWARHLLFIERVHTLKLSLPALLAVEYDGLAEVDAARMRQKIRHPNCFACGMAQPTLVAPVPYVPWLLGTGTLNFYRTLQTDTGSVQVQNLSGDTFQRDFARIVRRATLEGSLYVLRYMDGASGFTWIEQHGTLTVGDTGHTATLNLQQLLSGQDDTPAQNVSEQCQLVWGEKRCGATGAQECLYTYASCQIVQHFVGIQTSYETNNPASAAELPVTPPNRKKAW